MTARFIRYFSNPSYLYGDELTVVATDLACTKALGITKIPYVEYSNQFCSRTVQYFDSLLIFKPRRFNVIEVQ